MTPLVFDPMQYGSSACVEFIVPLVPAQLLFEVYHSEATVISAYCLCVIFSDTGMQYVHHIIGPPMTKHSIVVCWHTGSGQVYTVGQ